MWAKSHCLRRSVVSLGKCPPRVRPPCFVLFDEEAEEEGREEEEDEREDEEDEEEEELCFLLLLLEGAEEAVGVAMSALL